MRVLVPMAGGLRVGVVWEVGGTPPPGVTVRPVLWPLEREPLCDAPYLDLVRNLAARHLSLPGRILGALLPRGLRSAAFSFRCDVAGLPRRLTAPGDMPAYGRGADRSGPRLAPRDHSLSGRADQADPLSSGRRSAVAVRPGAARNWPSSTCFRPGAHFRRSELRQRLGPGLAYPRLWFEMDLVALDNGTTARSSRWPCRSLLRHRPSPP